MSDIVIKVENLGKKYIIGHQSKEKYTALRDVISNKVKSLGNLVNPKAKYENPNIEEFWALKDISLDIKQGDRVGIIGRNGAGKSTLLKILSRITEPTTGSIKIKGRVASLLEVGTGFHMELTGRENIFLNGAILGMSKVEIKRKFDEIVAFAEIEQFLDTPVKRYSSGMYVRLAFAVAAHLEPEILIVDEVLAVGDIAFQKKCLGKMEDVSGKEGRTVLFVSHNISSIRKLCNKGLFLEKGKLALDNSTDIEKALFAYQNNRYQSEQLLNLNIDIRSDYHKFIKIDYFKITKICVLDADDNNIYKFHTGDFLKVRIEFICLEKIVSPAFIIGCQSENGIKIFDLSTSPVSGYHINQLKEGEGYIELSIDKLNLLGGTYYFDISLARSGIQRYFTIEQAIRLNIEPTDIYESGFALSQKHGLIPVSHTWNYFLNEAQN
ncbi:MAG: ABC transporter ATP-binding protein [Sphaerospermopsis sp. SIO1G1]|nr:ABC transporter ATP-binding protein [Sphaerospermopsis sp. SIO1G1]